MSTYTDEFGDMDVIFAGGGTAACVAAGRLAKASPELRILLIEGGPDNYENPAVTNPALYLSHLVPDSKTALFYKGKKSKHLNDRSPIVPMGGLLGGGSSINFLMYTRAQGVDYDSWGMEGWKADDLLKLSKKVETFHPKGENWNKDLHGYDGPIQVSDGGFTATSADQFISTVKGMGYAEIPDLQDFESNDGFAKWQRYVGLDGKRQDAAHRCIHPLLKGGKHPNLHVLVESKVTRVIFDESKRAVGVEYRTNPEHQPIISNSKTIDKVVKAKKLVVVSAGALGTPQVLERSGVGNAEILKKLNINVVADLKGVGEEYQDHHLLIYPYKSSLPVGESLDEILSGRKEFAAAVQEKDPRLAWNAVDVAAKLRPTATQLTDLGPDFQKLYDRDFASQSSKPLALLAHVSTFLGDPSLVEPGQYFTLGAYSAYPYSRGSIHITSTDNVVDGYDFDTGFLSDPSEFDLKVQVWEYKLQREIARRLPYYRGELGLGHPVFPEGSAAKETPLGGGEVKDLVYSAEDDKIIEDWVRSNLNTTWHSLGTCKMGKREDGAVVDGDLNVYGTKGLKLCDLSVVPENVGANTNNTALVVGEKAAVIIGRELGIEV